jgi:hypothetical protein
MVGSLWSIPLCPSSGQTNYQQFNSGNFVLLSPAIVFTSQQYFLSSAAKVPHQSGQAGAELRLHPRLRVITDWLTDRIRISGENNGQNNFYNGSASQRINVADATGLRNDYNHIEIDVLWDVTSHLTLRGGYRLQWGFAVSCSRRPDWPAWTWPKFDETSARAASITGEVASSG